MPVASANNGMLFRHWTSEEKRCRPGRGKRVSRQPKPQGRRQQGGSDERDREKGRELVGTRERKKLRERRGDPGERSTTNRQGHDGSRAPGRWEISQTYTASPSRVRTQASEVLATGPFPPSPLPFAPQVSFPRSFGLAVTWLASHLFPGRLTVSPSCPRSGGRWSQDWAPSQPRRIESGGGGGRGRGRSHRRGAVPCRALVNAAAVDKKKQRVPGATNHESTTACGRADDGKRRVG
jgi:hypothetical protein